MGIGRYTRNMECDRLLKGPKWNTSLNDLKIQFF